MPQLKLEVFSPGAESESARQKEIARRVAEAYREGHAKGFAQGAEASAREHAEAQEQLRAQFVEALRDAQITQTVAEREVVASLLPLVLRMVERLAPPLAEAGLATLLRDRLAAALRARPDARPRVHCAPELEAGVRRALARFADRFTLVPDTSLTPLEARLHWEDGFDEIDLEGCLAEMRDRVERFRAAALEETQEEARSDAG